MYNGTFHEATGFLFVVAQFFGIMPVIGVKDKSVKSLRFKLCSLRFIHSVLQTINMAIYSGFTVAWIARKKMEFGKMISLVFVLSNFLSIVVFMILARNWPKLMMKWNHVENLLPPLPHQLAKQELAYKIKITAMTIFLTSMSESIVFLIIKKIDLKFY